MLENALWLCYHMLRQKISHSEIEFHRLKIQKEGNDETYFTKKSVLQLEN